MGVRLKLLLRVCAVGSSLLLVAAFVVHRAGAWGGLVQAESTAAARPSPTTESAEESRPEKPLLMGGSKSVPLDFLKGLPTAGDPRPRPRPRATVTTSPDDKVILGGSKNFIIDPSTPAPKDDDDTSTPPSDE